MPRKSASVADLMREWRKLAGLKTTAAGERLGLSARAIEDIEQGRSCSLRAPTHPGTWRLLKTCQPASRPTIEM